MRTYLNGPKQPESHYAAVLNICIFQMLFEEFEYSEFSTLLNEFCFQVVWFPLVSYVNISFDFVWFI